jgi:hypothetical protein
MSVPMSMPMILLENIPESHIELYKDEQFWYKLYKGPGFKFDFINTTNFLDFFDSYIIQDLIWTNSIRHANIALYNSIKLSDKGFVMVFNTFDGLLSNLYIKLTHYAYDPNHICFKIVLDLCSAVKYVNDLGYTYGNLDLYNIAFRFIENDIQFYIIDNSYILPISRVPRTHSKWNKITDINSSNLDTYSISTFAIMFLYQSVFNDPCAPIMHLKKMIKKIIQRSKKTNQYKKYKDLIFILRIMITSQSKRPNASNVLDILKCYDINTKLYSCNKKCIFKRFKATITERSVNHILDLEKFKFKMPKTKEFISSIFRQQIIDLQLPCTPSVTNINQILAEHELNDRELLLFDILDIIKYGIDITALDLSSQERIFDQYCVQQTSLYP